MPRMNRAAAEEYIASLYATLLKRDPLPEEFALWVTAATEWPAEKVYFAFVNSKEYKRRQERSVPTISSPGQTQHAQIGVMGGPPAEGVSLRATRAEQGQPTLSRESTTDRMPRFVFLAPDGAETSLDPHSPATSARIQAIAAHLRKKMPPGGAIGLLYRSEPNLIVAWFAALVAGLRPLVMQYPTRKQSRAYWIDSVRNTVATAGLAGIVADDYCASLDLAEFPNPVAQAELDGLPDAAPGPVLPDDFTIIQLSSGTTGYRKAMEFTSAALARHVADYNQVLGLAPGEDRIASWLPLYHDMGYIACFVMPILLGIDVVMMDPMDWVKQPEMLVDRDRAAPGDGLLHAEFRLRGDGAHGNAAAPEHAALDLLLGTRLGGDGRAVPQGERRAGRNASAPATRWPRTSSPCRSARAFTRPKSTASMSFPAALRCPGSRSRSWGARSGFAARPRSCTTWAATTSATRRAFTRPEISGWSSTAKSTSRAASTTC